MRVGCEDSGDLGRFSAEGPGVAGRRGARVVGASVGVGRGEAERVIVPAPGLIARGDLTIALAERAVADVGESPYAGELAISVAMTEVASV